MLHLIALLLLTQQPLLPIAEGVASYYTVASTGSDLTASGELLKDDAYTCAMRKGELGSYMLVVAENGSSVVCRLNDRGPYVKKRIIDLSEAAMRRLDTRAGTLKVRVYSLGKDLPDQLAQLVPSDG
ncbi:MAG: septal ring lytic transglycosylase RlpA family lipoprotein [Candidatus Hydrogenedentes bacterium]|nr:septal ring lytic transglycosylase RlpA family lipoprotein [Candidatus Hydrogenedentota bacterium]